MDDQLRLRRLTVIDSGTALQPNHHCGKSIFHLQATHHGTTVIEARWEVIGEWDREWNRDLYVISR